ncbi:MAG TPA: hypothetical protein VNU45_00780 [Rummeliibacillus sp.]|nr:hypothetical protein [Rummeliibacillus sp.]
MLLLILEMDIRWQQFGLILTDGGQYLSYKDFDGGTDDTGSNWVSWSTMVGKVHTVSFSR